MGQQVCMGATCQCSFGTAPSTLVVPPTRRVTTGTPDATVMDHQPFANVMPFGMCTSASNPTVAAATAAALGVPTPMPCVPMTVAPWMPGSPTVLIGGVPSLNTDSKLACAWGGVIGIVSPGQGTVSIP